MAPSKKKGAACLWVGIGCAVIAALAAVVVAGLVFFGIRTAKELQDPVARARNVKEILGADALPQGYYPVFGMKVPWFLEFAILSDEEITFDNDNLDEEDLGEKTFIYFKFLRKARNKGQILDFFEGRTDDPAVFDDANFQIDIDEVMGRGVVHLADFEALYVATRAQVTTDNSRSDGLSTLLLIDCPGDEKTRLAIWTEPDLDLGPEAETLQSTTGDENEIRAFLGHFALCQE